MRTRINLTVILTSVMLKCVSNTVKILIVRELGGDLIDTYCELKTKQLNYSNLFLTVVKLKKLGSPLKQGIPSFCHLLKK